MTVVPPRKSWNRWQYRTWINTSSQCLFLPIHLNSLGISWHAALTSNLMFWANDETLVPELLHAWACISVTDPTLQTCVMVIRTEKANPLPLIYTKENKTLWHCWVNVDRRWPSSATTSSAIRTDSTISGSRANNLPRTNKVYTAGPTGQVFV